MHEEMFYYYSILNTGIPNKDDALLWWFNNKPPFEYNGDWYTPDLTGNDRHGKLTNGLQATFENGNTMKLIDASKHLTGISVTSIEGAAEAFIRDDNVIFSNGTCRRLELSNGSVYTFSEVSNPQWIIDTSDNNMHMEFTTSYNSIIDGIASYLPLDGNTYEYISHTTKPITSNTGQYVDAKISKGYDFGNTEHQWIDLGETSPSAGGLEGSLSFWYADTLTQINNNDFLAVYVCGNAGTHIGIGFYLSSGAIPNAPLEGLYLFFQNKSPANTLYIKLDDNIITDGTFRYFTINWSNDKVQLYIGEDLIAENTLPEGITGCSPMHGYIGGHPASLYQNYSVTGILDEVIHNSKPESIDIIKFLWNDGFGRSFIPYTKDDGVSDVVDWTKIRTNNCKYPTNLINNTITVGKIEASFDSSGFQHMLLYDPNRKKVMSYGRIVVSTDSEYNTEVDIDTVDTTHLYKDIDFVNNDGILIGKNGTTGGSPGIDTPKYDYDVTWCTVFKVPTGYNENVIFEGALPYRYSSHVRFLSIQVTASDTLKVILRDGTIKEFYIYLDDSILNKEVMITITKSGDLWKFYLDDKLIHSGNYDSQGYPLGVGYRIAHNYANLSIGESYIRYFINIPKVAWDINKITDVYNSGEFKMPTIPDTDSYSDTMIIPYTSSSLDSVDGGLTLLAVNNSLGGKKFINSEIKVEVPSSDTELIATDSLLNYYLYNISGNPIPLGYGDIETDRLGIGLAIADIKRKEYRNFAVYKSPDENELANELAFEI